MTAPKPRPRKRPEGNRWAASGAAIVLMGVTVAQVAKSGHVDGALVYALLAIVLTAGGARLDRAILRNLGDRLYEAAGEPDDEGKGKKHG